MSRAAGAVTAPRSPRRVVIVAVGSRGDVQPSVALGLGLRDAGWDVVVAAASPFSALVRDRGLGFADLRIDPTALLADEAGRLWVESGGDLPGFLRGLRALTAPTAPVLATAIAAACRGADAVVYNALGFPAWHVAQAERIPAVQMAFAPTAPTAAFPPPLLPDPFDRLRALRPDDAVAGARGVASVVARAYHRTAHRLFAQLLWLPLRRDVNRWRRALGLRALGWTSPALHVDRDGELLLHAFSPALLPPPRDWGRHVVTTGHWPLAAPAGWRPSARLQRFLAAGPPPVSIGLGSMTGTRPDLVGRVVVDALRRTGQRGLVLSGWAQLDVAADDVDLLVEPDVPHDWLFPRVAATVHHGGAGTTAAGLRAGRPAVVIPHFGDQPLWAGRVAALGAGPAPVPRRQLTATALAHAISAAAHDPRLSAAAARLGARLRAERGVERAVTAFTDVVGLPQGGVAAGGRPGRAGVA